MTSHDPERSSLWPQYTYGQISRKRVEIETWVQWSTYRKWLPGIRMVTWLMKSRDPKRSRSWPQYILGPLSRQRLEIRTCSHWSTYRKWLLGIRWSRERWRHVTLNGQIVTLRDPKVQDWYQFMIRFQRPHKWKWKYNNVGSVTMRLFTA